MNWRERLQASTAAFLPGTALERCVLGALLLLALLLRFWGFPSIPYTHDEISALVRVDFPSLSDAINKGVWNIDTHPPGTHALLWVWTQLFGFGDGVVKAPFIAMSVLALFCLYRFAHAWAGAAVAVITTALLATMQYTVMYGQIARPYAMGLFTTALLADQLARYIGTGRKLNLVLLALAAVLSAYTHHFALMLAAFMYGTGFFLIDRSQRKPYLVAMAGAAVCYLPNLPLFFAQLGWKGLDEWLRPPGADWLPNYAWWIAHCSPLFGGLLIALVLGAIAMRIKHRGASLPLWSITLIWGLLPLVIGYAYSLWRAPVLQYSVVLFSFPYILVGALAGLRSLSPLWNIPIAGIAAVISVGTLVSTRQHFALSTTSKYEDIVRGTISAETDGMLAIVDMPPEVMAFYRKLWCVNPSQAPHVNLRQLPACALDSLLRNTTATEAFYGQTTHAAPENVSIVQVRFPFMAFRCDRVDGQTFRFRSRPVGEKIEDTDLKALRTPQAIGNELWQLDPSVKLIQDSVHAPFLLQERWDFSGHEFGAVFEKPVAELVRGANDVIEVQAVVESSAADSELRMVAELMSEDSSVFYRASSLPCERHRADSRKCVVSVKLADLPGHGRDLRLKAYIYNPGGRRATVSALQVRVRAGNPVLYAAFAPILGPWRYR